MTKKLIQHGNSAALVIEKPILQLLNIDFDTNLEIVVYCNNESLFENKSSMHILCP